MKHVSFLGFLSALLLWSAPAWGMDLIAIPFNASALDVSDLSNTACVKRSIRICNGTQLRCHQDTDCGGGSCLESSAINGTAISCAYNSPYYANVVLRLPWPFQANPSGFGLRMSLNVTPTTPNNGTTSLSFKYRAGVVKSNVGEVEPNSTAGWGNSSAGGSGGEYLIVGQGQAERWNLAGSGNSLVIPATVSHGDCGTVTPCGEDQFVLRITGQVPGTYTEYSGNFDIDGGMLLISNQ